MVKGVAWLLRFKKWLQNNNTKFDQFISVKEKIEASEAVVKLVQGEVYCKEISNAKSFWNRPNISSWKGIVSFGNKVFFFFFSYVLGIFCTLWKIINVHPWLDIWRYGRNCCVYVLRV